MAPRSSWGRARRVRRNYSLAIPRPRDPWGPGLVAHLATHRFTARRTRLERRQHRKRRALLVLAVVGGVAFVLFVLGSIRAFPLF